MTRILMLACLAMTPVAALADQAAAAACKGALSPLGLEIYTATLARNPTPSTARGIITGQVKKLVTEGKATIAQGRTAAEAAGKCLALLK